MLPLAISLPRDLEPETYQPPAWATEVLLEHRDLARLGFLDSSSLQRILKTCVMRGLSATLVWDILADDQTLVHGQNVLAELPMDQFHAIRVSDPGIAAFLKERYPDIPLQLNLETGNHNLPGIQAWVREFQPQRLVLSNELPLDQLARIRKAIDVPIETLAMGRILLFYTPRPLISGAKGEDIRREIAPHFVTSVEDGKHFPIEENQHGTFMYYEKDLFLLPYLEQIENAGLDAVRFELKFYPQHPLDGALEQFFDHGEGDALARIRSCLGPRLTRGFFKSNRTDKQFKKLKNVHLIPLENRDYLGTVVESRKKEYIAQVLEKTIAVGDWLTYQVPEGDLVDHQLTWISDKDGHKVQQTPGKGLWLVNHRGGISPGTRVFRTQPAKP